MGLRQMFSKSANPVTGKALLRSNTERGRFRKGQEAQKPTPGLPVDVQRAFGQAGAGSAGKGIIIARGSMPQVLVDLGPVAKRQEQFRLRLRHDRP